MIHLIFKNSLDTNSYRTGLRQKGFKKCLQEGLRWVEFEDTKGVIRICILKTNIQDNGQKKKIQKDKQRSTKHTQNYVPWRKQKYNLYIIYSRNILNIWIWFPNRKTTVIFLLITLFHDGYICILINIPYF